MEITVQEYQLIDIRSVEEIAHGAIPGAICTPVDGIEGNSDIDITKKLIICCSRGESSIETALKLVEKGYVSGVDLPKPSTAMNW